jgi:hypothetical protein
MALPEKATLRVIELGMGQARLAPNEQENNDQQPTFPLHFFLTRIFFFTGFEDGHNPVVSTPTCFMTRH